ncbi:MAG: hypothetical protein E7Z84_05425 [Methanosphaera stadtmanae]|nr:hypothetical protein [Methanosphaera stadtmanae]
MVTIINSTLINNPVDDSEVDPMVDHIINDYPSIVGPVISNATLYDKITNISPITVDLSENNTETKSNVLDKGIVNNARVKIIGKKFDINNQFVDNVVEADGAVYHNESIENNVSDLNDSSLNATVSDSLISNLFKLVKQYINNIMNIFNKFFEITF